jgi:hypothetical protein
LTEIIKGRVVKTSHDENTISTSIKIEKLNHELIELEYPLAAVKALDIHQWVKVEYEPDTMRARYIEPIKRPSLKQVTTQRKQSMGQYLPLTRSLAVIAGILALIGGMVMWSNPIIALYFYAASGMLAAISLLTRERNW